MKSLSVGGFSNPFKSYACRSEEKFDHEKYIDREKTSKQIVNKLSSYVFRLSDFDRKAFYEGLTARVKQSAMPELRGDLAEDSETGPVTLDELKEDFIQLCEGCGHSMAEATSRFEDILDTLQAAPLGGIESRLQSLKNRKYQALTTVHKTLEDICDYVRQEKLVAMKFTPPIATDRKILRDFQKSQNRAYALLKQFEMLSSDTCLIDEKTLDNNVIGELNSISNLSVEQTVLNGNFKFKKNLVNLLHDLTGEVEFKDVGSPLHQSVSLVRAIIDAGHLEFTALHYELAEELTTLFSLSRALRSNPSDSSIEEKHTSLLSKISKKILDTRISSGKVSTLRVALEKLSHFSFCAELGAQGFQEQVAGHLLNALKAHHQKLLLNQLTDKLGMESTDQLLAAGRELFSDFLEFPKPLAFTRLPRPNTLARRSGQAPAATLEISTTPPDSPPPPSSSLLARAMSSRTGAVNQQVPFAAPTMAAAMSNLSILPDVPPPQPSPTLLAKALASGSATADRQLPVIASDAPPSVTPHVAPAAAFDSLRLGDPDVDPDDSNSVSGGHSDDPAPPAADLRQAARGFEQRLDPLVQAGQGDEVSDNGLSRVGSNISNHTDQHAQGLENAHQGSGLRGGGGRDYSTSKGVFASIKRAFGRFFRGVANLFKSRETIVEKKVDERRERS